MSKPGPWLVSRRFDWAFFMFPGLLALLMALPNYFGFGPQGDVPLWAWVIFVLGVDVSHVWASLYRVYLDPTERRRRPILYYGTPIVVFLLGLTFFNHSSGLFWRILAYLAVFHFIKQQWGFVSLYRAKGKQLFPAEGKTWVCWIDKFALWVGTLVPIVYWHVNLPLNFNWFVDLDFIPGLPAKVMWVAWPIYGVAALAYVCARTYLWLTKGVKNPGKDLTMGLTWAIYAVGIVWVNLDFTFTITNIMLHGTPYIALVWASCQPPNKATPSLPSTHSGEVSPHEAPHFVDRISRPKYAILFVLLLLTLACVEEGLWDVFVWHENAKLYSALGLPSHLGTNWVAYLIPLLTVPQATHYVLDAFIWKMDSSNPGLRERLGLNN